MNSGWPSLNCTRDGVVLDVILSYKISEIGCMYAYKCQQQIIMCEIAGTQFQQQLQ